MAISFHFRTSFFLLCLILAIVCAGLGNWQLQRYSAKKNLLARYQNNLAHQPEAFTAIYTKVSAAALEFRQVSLTGQYITQNTFLLQNRFYHDQLGYEVITPIRLPNQKKQLLVDRGWIPQSPQWINKATTPIPTPQTIKGYIKLQNTYQFTLGKNILDVTFPVYMQKIDINELQHITHEEYYPFILRLNPQSDQGFVRDWVITTVLPERHLAYAVQWFGLMITLVIAYFCFSIERKRV